MQFLHNEFQLDEGDVIQVVLDHQANVLLMNSTNFEAYKRGQPYRYHGGLAKESPVRLVPPRPGTWHVVVDLGGYAGTVRAGVSLIKATVEAT